MSEFKMTRNYVEIVGKRYFRVGSGEAALMAVGLKRKPLGGAASFEEEGRIKRAKVRGPIRCGKPVTISLVKSSKTDVEVNGGLKVFGLDGEVATALSFEQAKTADLKVVSFEINGADCKKLLNGSPAALKFLADHRANGTFVIGGVFALTAVFSERFGADHSGSVEAETVAGGEVEITANHSSKGSTTISLKNGIIGYRLGAVKKWNSDRTLIEEIEVDEPGRLD